MVIPLSFIHQVGMVYNICICMYVCVCVCVCIYIYIVTVLVVTNSLCAFEGFFRFLPDDCCLQNLMKPKVADKLPKH